MKPSMTPVRIVLLSAAFMAAGANLAFFGNLQAALAGTPAAGLHLASLAVVLFCVLVLLLTLLTPRRALKPVLIGLFFASAAAGYFMDTYNVIIDADMVANVMATDRSEALDLFSWRLLGYLGVLGLAPSAVLAWVRVKRRPLRDALFSRLALAGSAALVILSAVLISSAFYASFIREHKSLRYYTNPVTPMYAAYKYVKRGDRRPDALLQSIGEDAEIPESDIDRELMVLVVGETARADHFSLNGYGRQTNPELERQDVISFTGVSACGTSTEISVPCMFSLLGRGGYSKGAASSMENVLDVLRHAEVNVLWRDNNSGSKGVADRVAYEDFSQETSNPLCDPECRDEGMLAGLERFIEAHPEGDILIVLHQMGSHGPAYYKRYPDDYRKFQPICGTNQLDACSREEIVNTYDNTILYTDHFLSRTIAWLTAYDDRFETALLYVSDHGESLGESGLYLHGLPYFAAPDSQTSVPVIFWFGPRFYDVDPSEIAALAGGSYSHDYVFHTLLGFFEVETEVYQPELDWLALSRARGP